MNFYWEGELFILDLLLNIVLLIIIGCQSLMTMGRNGRLEVSQFSVPTTSGTVSVIQRDALCNKSRLTTPDSLNTCPMCEEQRWIFNVPSILLWYTGPPSLGLDLKDPAILGLKAC